MDDETSRRRARETTEAPLPPERAFVIQLRAQTDGNGELFVEDFPTSGRRTTR